MSHTPRTPRARSGSQRTLGSMRMTHDRNAGTTLSQNDPALHINQLQIPALATGDSQREINKEKEYRERERKLNDQIAGLKKLIAQLQHQLKIKTEKCEELEKLLSKQSKEYEENLTQTKADHDKTKEELQICKADIEENKRLHQSTIDEYELKIKAIVEEYECKLTALQESKDRELKEKDEKLELLKRRIAVSLGNNSLERQQQLEELKKDLISQAQEARELQHKLKHFQVKSQHCSNCEKLQDKLEEKTLQLRLKEKTINELQGIGRKMQVQLSQQGGESSSHQARTTGSYKALKDRIDRFTCGPKETLDAVKASKEHRKDRM